MTTEVIRTHKGISTIKGFFYGILLIATCWGISFLWALGSYALEEAEKQLCVILVMRQMNHEFTVDEKGTKINGHKMSLAEAQRALVIYKAKSEEIILRSAQAVDMLQGNYLAP